MRSVVASAIGSVTINLHVSTMKFGLIGKTPTTRYSEISSRMLSNRTGTVLARLDNRTDFTSKPAAKIQPKWRKTRETRDEIFLKNQDRAFKHHQYHHLFFCDRFFFV